MEAISNAALALVSVAFLLALFSSLTAGRDNGRMRYISGVILTVYTLRFAVPIIKLVTYTDFIPSDTPEIPEINAEESDDVLIRAASAQICRDIKTLIVNRYGIPESAFTVSVTVERNDEKQILLKEITVKYRSGAIELSESEAEMIAKYISDMLAAPCTVMIEKPK